MNQILRLKTAREKKRGGFVIWALHEMAARITRLTASL
jgi:hypothetical protein